MFTSGRLDWEKRCFMIAIGERNADLSHYWTAARIKKNRSKTANTPTIKFKVRCSRHLYTLVLNDLEKADKLKQSLPPGTYGMKSCSEQSSDMSCL